MGTLAKWPSGTPEAEGGGRIEAWGWQQNLVPEARQKGGSLGAINPSRRREELQLEWAVLVPGWDQMGRGWRGGGWAGQWAALPRVLQPRAIC